MSKKETYEFAKLDNFRDLGGIPAADGRRVLPGRLLRSGDLSKVTGEDIRLLQAEHHVVNIVDLRTANERLASPDCSIEGTQYVSLDFFPEEPAEKATGSEGQLKHMQSAAQIDERMEDLYASFITDVHVRNRLYQFLQLLLQTKSGATLFHCYAGKDRTGITAAVILTMLGVEREQIIEDYLETNRLREKANRAILDSMKESVRSKEMQEAVLTALCVKQRYLEVSYETAKRQYGSFEMYVFEGIGLKERDRELLRAIYLTDL